MEHFPLDVAREGSIDNFDCGPNRSGETKVAGHHRGQSLGTRGEQPHLIPVTQVLLESHHDVVKNFGGNRSPPGNFGNLIKVSLAVSGD